MHGSQGLTIIDIDADGGGGSVGHHDVLLCMAVRCWCGGGLPGGLAPAGPGLGLGGGRGAVVGAGAGGNGVGGGRRGGGRGALWRWSGKGGKSGK